MGSIRFGFFGVLVSLVLAAVLISGTGSARADVCSFCHAEPRSPVAEDKKSGAEDIEQKVKANSDVCRFKIHAGLEFCCSSPRSNRGIVYVDSRSFGVLILAVARSQILFS